jgi:hypothetical protein
VDAVTKSKIRNFLVSNKGVVTIALVAMGVVGISGFVVVLTRASGFFASVEPANGTLSGNAKIVSDATAASGKAIQFTQPAVTPPPSGGATACDAKTAKPDATNTGVPAGTTLKTYSGTLVVNTNGTVVDGQDISNGLEIHANNVIVKNTRVRAGSGDGLYIYPGSTGTIVQDTEVGGGANGTTYTGVGVGIVIGDNSAKSAATTQLKCVRVHHTIDGLRSDGNLTVTNSYIYAPDPGTGYHGDGSQSTGWSNMIFKHNVIVGGLNAAIFLNTESPNPSIGAAGSIVIDSNWLGGFDRGSGDQTSFPLYVNGGIASNSVSVTNNRFIRGPWYAPAFDCSGTAISTWSNNVYDDNGAAITKPSKGC